MSAWWCTAHDNHEIFCPQQSVMGTVRRDIYGGSVDDMRRPSRSSRGTPSLARSSDILTSSSTISAGGDLDLDDIIAPPDDFCNGLMSRRAGKNMKIM